ncbi:MAG TPA: EAL domain-containing protein, partial [Novosphingobium sp.]|nr:EAL domain-containing protein [Novosphingobium sp.]
MAARSIFLWCCIWLMQCWAPPAQAETVRLREALCYAPASATMAPDPRAVAALPYDCAQAPKSAAYEGKWIWMRLRDARALSGMPAGWELQLDQNQFDKLAAIVITRDGRAHVDTIAPGAIGDHWTAGGMMRFTIAQPGAQIRDIYVGYLKLDDLSLMRKFSAAPPAEAARLERVWLALMGVFAGGILSAFAYNLLIYVGERLVFQRWYLAWSGLALAYGLSWTNIFAYAIPDYAGPVAVRTDYLLVTGLIATANMFLASVVEEGLLPRWLILCGRVAAVANLLAGFCAWSTLVRPAILIDVVVNVVFVASVAFIAMGVAIAIRGRSRVVWFYLAGWTPVLLVFAMRVARNFGLALQDDTVDMATFATQAFESVALSLAIADRFRMVGRERDAAEQASRVIQAESNALRRAAQTDFLTGLGNRAAFHAGLRRMCEQGAPFLLLLIDVDHLKDINDRLGHDGGDSLLGDVGRGLAAAVAGLGAGTRAPLVARIGGDEFAILLPVAAQDSPTDGPIRLALEELQGRTLTHSGRSWALSLSIGMARFPQDAHTAEVLVKNADLALYQAKQYGRRRLCAYDPALRARMDSRLTFAQEAPQAIENGQFRLFFQPIVDLATGAKTACEALLRWDHPEHGLMSPAIFGDMLHERKLGLAVQQHVLDMALAALRDHPDLVPALCVNFTAAQLDGPHAAQRLLARLADHGVDPARLCIELTEDIVLDRTIEAISCALATLREAGVRVALDDFGTGYASLIHLKQLPFDTLKIDRSFTLSLFEDDGQSEEIVRTILGLGQGLR